MQNRPNKRQQADVSLIARSFARNLLNQGFSQEDLIKSATILVDHAIMVQNDDSLEVKKPMSEAC